VPVSSMGEFPGTPSYPTSQHPWIVAPATPHPNIVDTVGTSTIGSPLDVARESGATSMAWADEDPTGRNKGSEVPEFVLRDLAIAPTTATKRAALETDSEVPWGWILGGGAAILALGVTAVVVVSGRATKAKRRTRRRR